MRKSSIIVSVILLYACLFVQGQQMDGKPDFYIDVTYEPEICAVGDIIIFNATIGNSGNASGSGVLKFFVDDFLLQQMNITDLPPGMKMNKILEWNTTEYIRGNHTVKLDITSLEDLNVENNTWLKNITLYESYNLTISLMMEKNNVMRGENFKFTIFINNSGIRSTTENLKIFLDENLFEEMKVYIPANSWYEKNISLNTHNLSVGNHSITTFLSGNISASLTFNVLANTSVALKNFSIEPKDAFPSQRINATLKVLYADCHNNISVGIFIQNDYHSPVASETVFLNGSGERFVSMSFTAPEFDGKIIITAIADYMNNLSDEKSDNVAYQSANIHWMPDLSIVSITPLVNNIEKDECSPGDSITVSVGVKNIGSSFTSSWSISLECVLEDEIIYEETMTYPGLNHSGTLRINYRFSVNDSGNLTIKIKVDSKDEINETNEMNNIKKINMIAVESHEEYEVSIKRVETTGKNFTTGDKIKFNITVENTGESVQNVTLTAYFKGGKVISEWSDIYIYDFSKGIRYIEWSWKTGRYSPGNYSITFEINSDRKYSEVNYKNNFYDVNLTLVSPYKEKPNLKIEELSVDRNAKKVRIVLENVGKHDVEGIIVVIYIDMKKRGEEIIPIIHAGEKHTVVVGTDFGVGKHSVIAEVSAEDISWRSETSVEIEKPTEMNILYSSIMIVAIIVAVVSLLTLLWYMRRKKEGGDEE